MQFDPCQHHITQVVLKAGAIIRNLKGLPPENNITILYNETAPMLGVFLDQMISSVADHLPGPSEMKGDSGFLLPHKPCPRCGKETFLNSICQSCAAAEGGKYKSGYTCDEKTGGCGLISDKTGDFLSKRLSELGLEIPTGMKASFGIKTLTDEGLK